jgi:hypothetical protein
VAEWVRSKYFATTGACTGVDGDQRRVRVLRSREGPAFGGEDEDFPATSLDTLLVTLMDRAHLDLRGAFRLLSAINSLADSDRALVLAMSRPLLREVARFAVSEARVEDATWRLQAICDRAHGWLGQVQAGLMHPCHLAYR